MFTGSLFLNYIVLYQLDQEYAYKVFTSLINKSKKDISKPLQNQLDNFKVVCGSTDEFENTHNTSII